jgi:hypothetical protein
VLALVILELDDAARGRSPEKVRRFRAELLTVPPERYPNIAEAAPFLSAPGDPDADFEISLDTIEAGAEALLPRAKGRAAKRRR